MRADSAFHDDRVHASSAAADSRPRLSVRRRYLHARGRAPESQGQPYHVAVDDTQARPRRFGYFRKNGASPRTR